MQTLLLASPDEKEYGASPESIVFDRPTDRRSAAKTLSALEELHWLLPPATKDLLEERRSFSMLDTLGQNSQRQGCDA